MKPSFNITLLLCLFVTFVFGDLVMGQIFRNRLSSNRGGTIVQPRDVYTQDGIKLSVDTPLRILKETAEQVPEVPEMNERTGDMDWTVVHAAKFCLGQCYLLGYNDCPKDEEMAAMCFNEIYEMLGIGHTNFERWTGMAIDTTGRNQRIYLPSPIKADFNDLMSKYIARIRQEAENGNVESQIKLGKYYTLGMGVKSNPQESAKWMRRAAEQGNTDAQYELAMFYAEGHGVRSSRTEFEKWWSRFEGQSQPQPTFTPLSPSGTRGGSASPAITSRRMRLVPGDVILAINGERIDAQEDVTSAIARSSQTMYLTVRDGRSGQVVELVTTLNSSRPRFGVSHQTHPNGGSRVLGVNRNSPAANCYLVE